MPSPLDTWIRSQTRRYGDAITAARAHQTAAWSGGRPVPAEEYLAALPDASDEDRLVLIMGEVAVRRELWQQPECDEYSSRFPRLAGELALQFELLDHLDEGDDEPVRVPGYDLGPVLGRGSAATVYRATHTATGGTVAVKVLHESWEDEPVTRVRFLREAEVLTRFDHPGIIRVLDFGAADDRLYLAMELAEGGSLADRIRGPLAPVADTVRLVAAVADALRYAHERGVGHRDVKPANVLLDAGGRPKLTDFGLAKTFGVDGLTTTRQFVGTPAYAAPEQVKDAAGTGVAYLAPEQAVGAATIGPAADVYAAGVILFECLTGTLPLLGDSPQDTLRMKLAQPPADPRALRAEVPAELAAVCLKCLAVRPADRFATAGDLATALRAAVKRRQPFWRRLFGR